MLIIDFLAARLDHVQVNVVLIVPHQGNANVAAPRVVLLQELLEIIVERVGRRGRAIGRARWWWGFFQARRGGRRGGDPGEFHRNVRGGPGCNVRVAAPGKILTGTAFPSANGRVLGALRSEKAIEPADGTRRRRGRVGRIIRRVLRVGRVAPRGIFLTALTGAASFLVMASTSSLAARTVSSRAPGGQIAALCSSRSRLVASSARLRALVTGLS